MGSSARISFGMIDQRARDCDALLLASGKLRGKMLDAVGEADAPRAARASASSVVL